MSPAQALSGRAVTVMAVRVGVGLALVIAGWLGSSDEVALDRQAPWVATAVAGLLVGAGSVALWLLQVRRAVHERILAVVAAVDALPGAAPVDLDDGIRVRRRRGAARLYHRPGCPLVVGRAVEAGHAADWLAAGAEPCAACEAGAEA